ncbi:MAG: ABC transporter ATP-binding protein [Actinomycetota bacterium]|nr:ABC transporter ATP-binding protein [Actinomycetota bacterium]
MLEFRNVTKRFETPGGQEVTVLQDVSFTVDDDEFCVVVGPSGCGKSTLLNLALGLVPVSEGEIIHDGKRVESIVSSDVGYITQDANLLPWSTVLENIMSPLEIRGVPKTERRATAREWAEAVGLGKFVDYYPGQLSGGMQKRCSIARTMVYDPAMIYMDEPFGPLDAITRTILQETLLNLWQTRRKTILFITHDLVEAIALGDTVVVINGQPGTVKAKIPIPLSRPREIRHLAASTEFVDLHTRIWSYLEPGVESNAGELV